MMPSSTHCVMRPNVSSWTPPIQDVTSKTLHCDGIGGTTFLVFLLLSSPLFLPQELPYLLFWRVIDGSLNRYQPLGIS